MAKISPITPVQRGSAGTEAAKLLARSSRPKGNVQKTKSSGSVGASVAGRAVPGATQVTGGTI